MSAQNGTIEASCPSNNSQSFEPQAQRRFRASRLSAGSPAWTRPRPPLGPPPTIGKAKQTIGGKSRGRGPSPAAPNELEQRRRAIILVSVLASGLVLTILSALVVARFEGFQSQPPISLAERNSRVAELEADSAALETAGAARAAANTTIYTDAGALMFQTAVTAPADANRANAAQFDHAHIYGIAGPDPGEAASAILNLSIQPTRTWPCAFSSHAHGWEAHGVCLEFAGSLALDPSSTLEHELGVLAIKFGEPALFKWWPHVWGNDRDHHHTFLQSVLPAAPPLARVASHHPIFLL